MKVGYTEINGDPCSKCCLTNVCTKEGKCFCDAYWEDHPEDTHNENCEVYFIEI